MSEWDKLNQWEKARITRQILYGTPNLVDLRYPEGSMPEEIKEKIRQAKKKNWADLSPDEQEKRVKRVQSGKNKFLKNLSPDEREAYGRAISEGLKKHWASLSTEEIEAYRRTISESWAKLTPEERKERGRAISEGRRKSKMLKEAQDRTVEQ